METQPIDSKDLILTFQNEAQQAHLVVAHTDVPKVAMVLAHLLQVYGIQCKVEVQEIKPKESEVSE